MQAMFLTARASSRSPHSRDSMVNVYIVDIHRLQCQVRQKNDQLPKRNTDGINVYIYIYISICDEEEKKGSWRFIEHRYIFRYPTFFALSIVIFAHHEGIRALFCALHRGFWGCT